MGTVPTRPEKKEATGQSPMGDCPECSWGGARRKEPRPGGRTRDARLAPRKARDPPPRERSWRPSPAGSRTGSASAPGSDRRGIRRACSRAQCRTRAGRTVRSATTVRLSRDPPVPGHHRLALPLPPVSPRMRPPGRIRSLSMRRRRRRVNPPCEGSSGSGVPTFEWGRLGPRQRVRRSAVTAFTRSGSTTPSSSTSVKKARAYGESAVRARTSLQSICSRRVRAISSTDS